MQANPVGECEAAWNLGTSYRRESAWAAAPGNDFVSRS